MASEWSEQGVYDAVRTPVARRAIMKGITAKTISWMPSERYCETSSNDASTMRDPHTALRKLEPISKFFGTIHSVNTTEVALWTLPTNSGKFLPQHWQQLREKNIIEVVQGETMWKNASSTERFPPLKQGPCRGKNQTRKRNKDYGNR